MSGETKGDNNDTTVSRLFQVTFTPLTHYAFREPGVREAGTHGPAAHGRSLPYPLPSTLAGALASACLQHSGGSHGTLNREGDASVYSMDELLQGALGREYRLYAGLAQSNDSSSGRLGEKLLVYFPPRWYIPLKQGSRMREISLEHLMHRLMEEINESEQEGNAISLKLPRLLGRVGDIVKEFHAKLKQAKSEGEKEVKSVVSSTDIGIALDRGRKTARERLLYTLERIDPLATGVSHLLLVKTGENPQCTLLAEQASQGHPPKILGSMGTRKTPTLIEITPMPETRVQKLLSSGEGTGGDSEASCIVYLASPALQEESPWSQTVTLTPQHLRELAKNLLYTNTSENESRLYQNPLVIHVPNTTPGLETLSAGVTSVPHYTPQPPHLHIPPGTILYFKTSNPEQALNHLYRNLSPNPYARQGWGTPITLCQPNNK